MSNVGQHKFAARVRDVFNDYYFLNDLKKRN